MKKSRINWAIERGCFYSIPREIERAFWLEIRRPMPFTFLGFFVESAGENPALFLCLF